MATQITQADVRWRNDDGTQVTATWIAALNTAISFPTGTNVRLRLSSLVTSGSATYKRQLQYNLNGAGWVNVGAVSSVARSSTSLNVVNATATTQQLGGGGTFTAGEVDTTVGVSVSNVTIDVAGNDTTEDEFCFQVRTADVTPGDQIQFRLADSSGPTAYTVYSNYGVFNVPAAAGTTRRKGVGPKQW